MTVELEYPRASFDDIDEATAYTLEFFPESTLEVNAMGELTIRTNIYELPDGSFAHRGATENTEEITDDLSLDLCDTCGDRHDLEDECDDEPHDTFDEDTRESY